MKLPWFESGKFPLFLAPMAGVTDPVFRSVCKELGADVMVTEFVSSEGILKAWDRNQRYTIIAEEHRPVGVQLFGSNGERMGAAAKIVLDHDKPDFIDINCGCPAPKVVGRNGGSSNLKGQPKKATEELGVEQAVGGRVPVTVKIRIGWDASSICALETCHIVQEEGASMVTVHGRTRTQQYSGQADWDIIDRCARSVSIPVVGNGDIVSGPRVRDIRDTLAVSGVMIGRAAMQNPWIFSDAKYCLEHGGEPPARTAPEKWAMVLKHAKLAVESRRYGDELGTMKFMRGKILAYSKGEPGAKAMRAEIVRISSFSELEAIIERFSQG